MKRVLVLGGDGQLGRAFVETLESAVGADGRVLSVDVQHVDVREGRALRDVVDGFLPDAIINCTAWNGVDQAEQAPVDALATNSLAVRRMAEAAAAHGAVFVHFSTDFVFDGNASAPYSERDTANPVSTYGMSKLLGEMASEAAPRHYVLRLSSLYGGPARRSYIDYIANALRAEKTIPVFTDRIVSPSYAPDVVTATLRLIETEAPHGVYHCASRDAADWHTVGVEVASLLGVDGSGLLRTPFANLAGQAKRPKYCALSTEKLAAQIGPQPAWRDALARYLTRAFPAPTPNA